MPPGPRRPPLLPADHPAPREPSRPHIFLENLLGTRRPALPPEEPPPVLGAQVPLRACGPPGPAPFTPPGNVSLERQHYGAPGGQTALRLQGACAASSCTDLLSPHGPVLEQSAEGRVREPSVPRSPRQARVFVPTPGNRRPGAGGGQRAGRWGSSGPPGSCPGAEPTNLAPLLPVGFPMFLYLPNPFFGVSLT